MYILPELPYAYDALSPIIDTRIMELHHAGHQKAYVDGLNVALSQHPELFKVPLPELLTDLYNLPDDIRVAVQNHGGGVDNHTFFWDCMTPKKDQKVQGPLRDAIIKMWGSFEQFQTDFEAAAKSVFGSGWAWLCVDSQGEIGIITTANQNSPYTLELTPILGLDVWEHAYYLQYVNKRMDYVKAWWHVVNWDKVQERYELAQSKI